MFSLLKKWRDALRARLIADAGKWWKMWSIRLAGLFSLIVGLVLAMPDVLPWAMNALPPEIRSTLPTATGTIVFVLITIVRLWSQSHPKDKNDG